jgi:hypothetical protein
VLPNLVYPHTVSPSACSLTVVYSRDRKPDKPDLWFVGSFMQHSRIARKNFVWIISDLESCFLDAKKTRINHAGSGKP